MPNRSNVLVVDDEISIVEVLKALLTREGYTVTTASNGNEALEELKNHSFDLLITDVRMTPIDGLTLLKRAKKLHEHLAVVIITAFGSVESAVEAMKHGAFDYVSKPFKVDELLITVERAIMFESTIIENRHLKANLHEKYHFDKIIGDTEAMREVYANIQKVAQTNSTVLIYGKSGTGKELVSRALHNCSERSEEPFVAINCAALPETLLESELFGYVKGAFTGANKYKEGLFESADGGTLFLDEISSLPLQLQSKLLRVLEERKVRPIGATESIPVDVRIVVATNEPLEEKVQEGAFREDLYYRLSVIPIELPPLRERVSDIPLLVQHFLKQIQDKEDRNVSMEKPALQALQQHNWPGNVRELENAVLRAATLCDDNTIKVKDLPGAIRESTKSATAGNTEKESDTPKAVSSACITLKAFLQAKEREYITYVLEQCGGDKNKAAEILGISLATFYRKLQDA